MIKKVKIMKLLKIVVIFKMRILIEINNICNCKKVGK